MMSGVGSPVTNITYAECRQRAATITVDDYRIELDLAGAADPDTATFRSRSTIAFTARAEQTWVDLIADRVVRATLNGRELDPAGYDGARLPLTGLSAGRNELLVEADCRYSRTGEGLHRFTDPVDGATYLYTHFEPTDARRVFANFEQPDLKARFTFVVTAPSGWRILSGAAEESRTAAADGEPATVTFARTPPQSTYLTAVAAGPYHRVEDVWTRVREDGSAQEVALGALCRASMAEHFEPAAILTVTRQGLDFFDDAFGFPYPWGKYDSIFVPEYNLGAMENPGLVTFSERFVHRGAATRADRARRAEVILHEMAHMWFGDLVTPRWWDGTWLKESFADLMGYHVSEAATEFDGAWTTFAGRRKAWAYHQDQLPTTHPIVARVDDLEAARQNFDGITYAKGASALKQLMAYVGPAEFFAGSREYFARLRLRQHRARRPARLPGARVRARPADLVAGLAADRRASRELTPEVTTDADGRITRLVVTQSATDPVTGAPLTRPHRLVIGLYDAGRRRAAARSGRSRRTWSRSGPRSRRPSAARPRWCWSTTTTSATPRCAWTPGSLAAVRSAPGHDPGAAEPGAGLVGAVERDPRRGAAGGRVPGHRVRPGRRGSRMRRCWRRVLGDVGSAIEHYLPAGARAAARARFVETCRAGAADGGARVGRAAHLGPAADPRRVDQRDGNRRGPRPARRRRAPDGLRIDADLRWDCWVALSAQGAASPAELDAALAADDTMTGRQAHELALAIRPGHPRGDLAAGDQRRVAVQRPAARAGPRLQPPRPSPTNPGTRSATSTRSSAGGRPER